MSRFQFVDDHRDAFGGTRRLRGKRLCRVVSEVIAGFDGGLFSQDPPQLRAVHTFTLERSYTWPTLTPVARITFGSRQDPIHSLSVG